jgi:hypothetical protein
VKPSQLNVRLSSEAVDALEAAVFVRSLRSAQELVGPVVEHLAQQLLADEDVAAAVKLRAGRQGPSNVTSMRPAKALPKQSASARKSGA